MALICNVIVRDPAASGDWQATYAQNEVFVEAGSAYFAKAFAEALGLVADIELHDTERASLRVLSIKGLLSNALTEYHTSLTMDSETGLGEHHRGLLKDAAAAVGGFDTVLSQARDRDFVGISDEQIAALSVSLDEHSYGDLMGMYLEDVAKIVSLLDTAPVSGGEAVAWQEFTWRVITIFSGAMALGQAIAILNTYTLRAVRGSDLSATCGNAATKGGLR